MNKIRTHIFVSGRVQGVGFRLETHWRAKKLGLYGFVQNLSDGRVEVVLEGEREKVEKLIEWIKRGPFLARVDNIEIKEEDCKGEFDSFEVKY